MNTITITGNLGRDPETRQAGSKNVVSASVAVSQGKDKPSMWLDVSAWEDGYTAWAANELSAARKGQKVVVSGRLSMREWTDKEGKPRQSWGITAQDVERVAPKIERDEIPGGSSKRYSSDKKADVIEDEDVPW